MWLDNDYMLDNQNFIWDNVNFKGVKSYVENYLHKLNIKFIPVVDGGDIALRKAFVNPDDKVFDLYNNSYPDSWMKAHLQESHLDPTPANLIG